MEQYWFKRRDSYVPGPRRFPFEPIDWRGYVFVFGWLIVSTIGATLISSRIDGQQGKLIAIAFLIVLVIPFILIVKAKIRP